MRRVVVTGLGLVTPLASGVEETWSRLLAGKSGARPITKFRTDDLATKIACQVPARAMAATGRSTPITGWTPMNSGGWDDFIVFGLAAAKQAVRDSGWEPKTEEDRCRTGVLIGSGIGGLPGIEEGAILVETRGPRRLSPVLHSRPADQPDLRLCLDRAWLQGSESFRGHGLRHRRARHRRRRVSSRSTTPT
ncbi:MAG: beta-ketoacyl synthase N-terminal-like domain-containing protein [Rhizomicrobium sp.]